MLLEEECDQYKTKVNTIKTKSIAYSKGLRYKCKQFKAYFCEGKKPANAYKFVEEAGKSIPNTLIHVQTCLRHNYNFSNTTTSIVRNFSLVLLGSQGGRGKN